MPVRLNPKTGQWEFDTAAEAIEFARLQTQAETSTVVRERPATRSRRRVRSKGVRRSGRASIVPASREGALTTGSRRILEVVRTAMAPGIQTEDFARAIGVQTTQIPIRVMLLSKELRALGLKPEDVFRREKIYVKGRARSVFSQGPRIDDALRRTADLFAVAK